MKLADRIRFGYGELHEYSLPTGLLGVDDWTVAREFGRSNGCPVVLELIDPNHPDQEKRGPTNMRRRYGEINRMFRRVVDIARDLNPQLKRDLVSPVSRVAGEGVGKFEVESVPELYRTTIYPMNRPAGYGLPRLMLAVMQITSTSLMSVRRMLWEASIESESGDDLLAVSVGIVDRDYPRVGHAVLLRHALAVGVMEEQNSKRALEEVANRLGRFAPDVERTLRGLNDQEKKNFGIAAV